MVLSIFTYLFADVELEGMKRFQARYNFNKKKKVTHTFHPVKSNLFHRGITASISGIFFSPLLLRQRWKILEKKFPRVWSNESIKMRSPYCGSKTSRPSGIDYRAADCYNGWLGAGAGIGKVYVGPFSFSFAARFESEFFKLHQRICMKWILRICIGIHYVYLYIYVQTISISFFSSSFVCRKFVDIYEYSYSDCLHSKRHRASPYYTGCSSSFADPGQDTF